MNKKIINDMLQNIQDPAMQRMYGSILNGDIVKQVRCMSPVCDGVVIATIDKLGVVSETQPTQDEAGTYISGLEGSRKRFDGQVGFRCFCGNESILSEEERGIITPARPTKDDLERVAIRLSHRKHELYVPVRGVVEVDGFRIEDV